jgi:hypothetical protein
MVNPPVDPGEAPVLPCATEVAIGEGGPFESGQDTTPIREDQLMARGKHGASAAARRTQTEYEEQIAALEKKVNDLLYDRLVLEGELEKSKESQRSEVARLNQQIAEGASDQLAEQKALNEVLREAIGAMRENALQTNEQWRKWQKNAHTYAIEHLGMTVAGAVLWMHELGEVPYDKTTGAIAAIAEHGSRAELVSAIRERAGKRA